MSGKYNTSKEEDNLAQAKQKARLNQTAHFLDVGFWQKLAPHFSIGNPGALAPFSLAKGQQRPLTEKFVKEGYIHLLRPGLKSRFEKIAELFAELADLGLPPVFSFVYDELWLINSQLHPLIELLLHREFAMLPDFWAWRVMPGQSGWKPHRDKPSGSLFADKRPKSVTVWVPITQATPINGCMYVLPADRDLEYGQENSVRGAGTLPEIRALPAEAGDVLAWTQHLFHWGSHSADEHDLPPRMSIAFEYQRSDVAPFNQPLLDPTTSFSFEERLALIAKQILQYRHMYTYTDELVDLAKIIGQKHRLPQGLTF